MQQVIIIHGGTSYADYGNFLNDLATKKLYADRFTFKPMWKELLQEELGDSYQVLLPSMPNKTNAKYSEWEIWFRHFTEMIEDGCILIGHSLGAIFLAKYLSENIFPRTIKATILVAAPYDDEETEDLTDFKLDGVSDLFKEQAGEVFFFFGSDDPVISAGEIDKYKKDLPEATFSIIPAPDHFVRQDFPELTALIKEL
jgi:predicted alpha/beta hydrolase family esterase